MFSVGRNITITLKEHFMTTATKSQKTPKKRKSYYIPPELLKEFNHVRIDLDCDSESDGIELALREFVENHKKGGK